MHTHNGDGIIPEYVIHELLRPFTVPFFILKMLNY